MVQDSRSASYPGAAIASSYDFGSIDFFFSRGGRSHPAAAAAMKVGKGASVPGGHPRALLPEEEWSNTSSKLPQPECRFRALRAANNSTVCSCDASGTQGSGIPAGIGADSGKFRLWTGIPGIRDCRRVLGSGGTPGVHTYSGPKIGATCTGISILGSFSRMSR